MTTTEQRAHALRQANHIRRERADLKAAMRDGTVTLDDLLMTPHPAVVDTPLIDVLLWRRRATRMQAPALARLGERAVRDRVNLLLPVGAASERVRAWCVVNGEPQGPRA